MNRFISSIQGSASMELIAKAKEWKSQGMDIIGLGGGEPDFDTPQIIKDVAIAEIQKGNTHYAVGPGIFKLRKRIAQKLKNDNGIEVSPDEIIVTPGCKMAIYLAVRSCINAGDEVLILDPSWVSYKEIVVAAGGVPVSVELRSEDNYTIKIEYLEKKLSSKTRMIILNSPNNPTGRVLNQQELDVLKDFVLEKDIMLLSDEVYEKIVYEGRKNLSPASDKQLRDKVITINGFSKSYAMTGWRLGYLAGNQNLIRIIAKLYTHTITGTSPFIQEAAIVALDCDAEVEMMRQKYEQRRNTFVTALKQLPGIEISMPEGAFYAWVKFNFKNMDSFHIADFLLKNAYVVGVPGAAYGMGTSGFIRFSFANADQDIFEAVKRIQNLVHTYY